MNVAFVEQSYVYTTLTVFNSVEDSWFITFFIRDILNVSKNNDITSNTLWIYNYCFILSNKIFNYMIITWIFILIFIINNLVKRQSIELLVTHIQIMILLRTLHEIMYNLNELLHNTEKDSDNEYTDKELGSVITNIIPDKFDHSDETNDGPIFNMMKQTINDLNLDDINNIHDSNYLYYNQIICIINFKYEKEFIYLFDSKLTYFFQNDFFIFDSFATNIKNFDFIMVSDQMECNVEQVMRTIGKETNDFQLIITFISSTQLNSTTLTDISKHPVISIAISSNFSVKAKQIVSLMIPRLQFQDKWIKTYYKIGNILDYPNIYTYSITLNMYDISVTIITILSSKSSHQDKSNNNRIYNLCQSLHGKVCLLMEFNYLCTFTPLIRIKIKSSVIILFQEPDICTIMGDIAVDYNSHEFKNDKNNSTNILYSHNDEICIDIQNNHKKRFIFTNGNIITTFE